MLRAETHAGFESPILSSPFYFLFVNGMADPIEYTRALLGRPDTLTAPEIGFFQARANVTTSTTLTTGSNNGVPIVWDTLDYNSSPVILTPGGGVSNRSNKTVIVIGSATVCFGSDSTGKVRALILQQGGQGIGGFGKTSAVPPVTASTLSLCYLTVPIVTVLPPGEQFYIGAIHDATTDITLAPGGGTGQQIMRFVTFTQG